MPNPNRTASKVTESRRHHSVLMTLLQVLGLAAIYFVVSKLGLLLAIPSGYATAVWPASGIALGCLLIYGVHLWPGVLIGSLLVNLSVSYGSSDVAALANSLLVPTSIGAGAAMQTALGVVLIRRYVGFPVLLDGEFVAIKFLLLAGPLACLLNATWGSTTLLISGTVSPETYVYTWWVWWVGDTIGVLIFTPLVLIALAPPRDVWLHRVNTVGIPLLMAFAVVVGIFSYTALISWGVMASALLFTGLLGAFLLEISGRTQKIERLVEQRTAELRLSEGRYRAIAGVAPVGIFHTDVHGDVTYVNEKWCQLGGMTREAAMGKGWLNALHPDDRQRVDSDWQKSVTTDYGFENEYRYVNSDGVTTWCFVRAMPELDESGDIIGYVGALTDINERKQAEEALRRSEQYFRILFDNATAGIGRSRLSDGKVLLANNKLADIFGYDTPEAFVAECILSERYVDPERRAQLIAGFAENSFQTNDLDFTKPDGSVITVRSYDRVNREAGWLDFVAIDITEQMRAEEALRKNEEYLRALVEAHPSPIFLKGLDGRYVIINSAYEKLLNSSRDEIIGKTVRELNLFDEEYIEEITAFDNEVLRTGEVVHREYHPVLPDGRTPTTILTKFPIFGFDGQPTGIGSMETDITEHKEAEKRLRNSEERLRQATQLARIGYYVWDAIEDRCLFCSDEHARIHGLSPDEYIARASVLDAAFSLTHPDDRDAVKGAMKDLRSGKPIDIEYRTITPSGESYYVREIAEPVFDEAGRVVQEIGASQDVTERASAEQEVRELNEHLEQRIEERTAELRSMQETLLR